MAFTIYPYNHLLSEAWAGSWHASATPAPDFRINLYTAFTFIATRTTKAQAETFATQVATGAGYTQNAKTLANVTVLAYQTTGIVFNTDPVIWYPPSGTTLTARHGLVYANGTTGSKPFMYIDFGESKSAASPLPFIITSAPGGWFTLNFAS